MKYLICLLLLAAAGRADEVDIWRRGAVQDRFRQLGWDVLDVRRIWTNPGFPHGDPATAHNAFPDLVRFRDQWYCAFRSAPNHGMFGTLRVLRSVDGDTWEPVVHLTPEVHGSDMRDAQFGITADGQLMLLTSIHYAHQPAKDEFAKRGLQRRTVTWLSTDGTTWSEPYFAKAGENTWIWSVTWYAGAGYGVGYSGKDGAGTLYRTTDGREWEIVKSEFFPLGADSGNEVSLAFAPDGRAYAYVRGGPRAGGAHFGSAMPPYTDWRWTSRISPNVGGPKLLRLTDGRLILGGRSGWGTPDSVNLTVLWLVDPEKPSFSQIVSLPSGGDTSYPGLVEHDGELWMAYYSTHEDPNPEGRNVWNQRGIIYLARLEIGTPQPQVEGTTE